VKARLLEACLSRWQLPPGTRTAPTAAAEAKTALNQPRLAVPDRQPSVGFAVLKSGANFRAVLPATLAYTERRGARYNAASLDRTAHAFVDVARALLDILGSLLVGLLLLRAGPAIGCRRATRWHFARALTDWLVKPLRE
jgi:hypothetical protein